MTYVFGIFEFDDVALELRKSGRLVTIEPQPARALALLLSRPGEVVTREEVAACVWGANHVDFNRGLAYCVGHIRAALGDSGDNSRFIQTLPKRGFRFIAPVKTLAPVAPVALAPKAPGRLRPWIGAAIILVFILAVPLSQRAVSRWGRPKVAVSIFDNETGDPRHDRAVHAMSDTVVDRLTQLGTTKLGVIGNASILRIPRNERDLERIESETGATHVVLAQLQPRKGELSLLMHLIRLDDGTHLWTRRIARPLSDPLDSLDEEAATWITAGVQTHVLQVNP